MGWGSSTLWGVLGVGGTASGPGPGSSMALVSGSGLFEVFLVFIPDFYIAFQAKHRLVWFKK